MIYIELQEDGENIKFTHNMPFHERYGLKKTQEELLQTGFLVESIPEPEEIENKIPILKYNNGDFVYEYVDRTPTEAEKIEALIIENEKLKKSQIEQDELIMALMLGGF